MSTSIASLTSLNIAMNPFDYISREIGFPLDYKKWVEYIEKKTDYFTWIEHTEDGRHTLENLSSFRESTQKKFLYSHNKKSAEAEFDKKKGFYTVHFTFLEPGYVSISFERGPSLDRVLIALDMAKYLDAKLLNNGTELIEESMLT